MEAVDLRDQLQALHHELIAHEGVIEVADG
jgi:hypothetical protein